MPLFSSKALSATIGKAKTATSGLGFGCMGITAFYGDSMPRDDAMKLLQAVYDAGCRHFDTAEVYATDDQHNEDVLGDFITSKALPRDSYSVATKYWPREGKYDYDAVKTSLAASLKRLKLDYVDLYYAHRVMSLEGGMEFSRVAQKLQQEGFIKEIGLSEVSGSWLQQIHDTTGVRIDAVQQEWSLLTRSLEAELVPVCNKLDVAIVAYSPLARNLLAVPATQEAPKDWRAKQPRYEAENYAKNQRLIVEQVHALATKLSCTPAQLSLAWLLQKAATLDVTVVPIPGSTKLTHALGNLQAAQMPALSADDMATLEGLAAQVAGERGNEGYMNMSIEAQS